MTLQKRKKSRFFGFSKKRKNVFSNYVPMWQQWASLIKRLLVSAVPLFALTTRHVWFKIDVYSSLLK